MARFASGESVICDDHWKAPRPYSEDRMLRHLAPTRSPKLDSTLRRTVALFGIGKGAHKTINYFCSSQAERDQHCDQENQIMLGLLRNQQKRGHACDYETEHAST